jgi:large subunit ribosomal protein L9e
MPIEMNLTEVEGKKFLVCTMWFVKSKSKAGINTVVTHVRNMVQGVTKGWRYKMRLVYAHFPISVTIEDAGKKVEIRNFLGEKFVRVVPMHKGVTVEVKKRHVTVVGPRGRLERSFRHMPIEMEVVEVDGKKILTCTMWFVKSKSKAGINTVVSHVRNMVQGVTRGWRYKMRLVYAHFPISVTIEDAGKKVEIRNFLGEKEVRVVPMHSGVTVERSADVKDELVLSGNSKDDVSQSAANIHNSVKVPKKDIRKFLDGIYVSTKAIPATGDD